MLGTHLTLKTFWVGRLRPGRSYSAAACLGYGRNFGLTLTQVSKGHAFSGTRRRGATSARPSKHQYVHSQIATAAMD